MPGAAHFIDSRQTFGEGSGWERRKEGMCLKAYAKAELQGRISLWPWRDMVGDAYSMWKGVQRQREPDQQGH